MASPPGSVQAAAAVPTASRPLIIRLRLSRPPPTPHCVLLQAQIMQNILLAAHHEGEGLIGLGLHTAVEHVLNDLLQAVLVDVLLQNTHGRREARLALPDGVTRPPGAAKSLLRTWTPGVVMFASVWMRGEEAAGDRSSDKRVCFCGAGLPNWWLREVMGRCNSIWEG